MFPTFYRPAGSFRGTLTLNQQIPEPLMIAFVVVMLGICLNCSPERLLKETIRSRHSYFAERTKRPVMA